MTSGHVFLDDARSALGQALELMEAALLVLDEHQAPDQIGAHLDLAICQLAEALGQPRGNPTGESQIDN